MPRPILRNIDIVNVINNSVDLIKISSKNSINIIKKIKNTFIKGDEDQLNRVFINLIKNSEEAFLEKIKKNIDFKGNIDIEITDNNDYIVVKLSDNGTGIIDSKSDDLIILQKTGTGLGLPIVTKIINEH